MDPKDNFKSVVPKYMKLLMKDFNLTKLDAAAVFGNAGYESLGFTLLQELEPVVKGSRGGFGWFQWTGPRRREFEAYCKRNKLDPRSNEANYKFLFVELTTTEKRALTKLKAVNSLEDKTIAFEDSFERAGVKKYPERVKWAKIALAAYEASEAIPIPKEPPKARTVEPPAPVSPPKPVVTKVEEKKQWVHPLVRVFLAIWRIFTNEPAKRR